MGGVLYVGWFLKQVADFQMFVYICVRYPHERYRIENAILFVTNLGTACVVSASSCNF